MRIYSVGQGRPVGQQQFIMHVNYIPQEREDFCRCFFEWISPCVTALSRSQG